MGCSSCSTGKDGKPGGCKSNGGCSSGGCNRLNTFDWLSRLDIHDYQNYSIVEVSFKQGSRKGFFRNDPHTRALVGDTVVVETDAGYDIGHISLSGELVRLQMRKKGIKEDNVLKSIIRRANERDLERMEEARNVEHRTMVRARVIARTLALDMKIGDVEFQGDKRKATFYYTADGRVDFRELIRHYAKEFKVKIEMRQIGARQESARIGGLGSCGRELCCSTWLSDFKTVSTAAARYQNLAINQAKLSGQCGRLKCCLNYELDTYLDALEEFPKRADELRTEVGKAVLVKTDIFKGLMYYAYLTPNGGRGKFYPLDLDRVKEIIALNKKGEVPTDLVDLQSLIQEEIEMDFDSINDVIELPPEERRKRSRNRRNRRKKPDNKKGPANASAGTSTKEEGKRDERKTEGRRNNNNRNKPSSRNGKPEGRKSQNGADDTKTNDNNNRNKSAKATTSERSDKSQNPKNKPGQKGQNQNRRPNNTNQKRRSNNNANPNDGNARKKAATTNKDKAATATVNPPKKDQANPEKKGNRLKDRFNRRKKKKDD